VPHSTFAHTHRTVRRHGATFHIRSHTQACTRTRTVQHNLSLHTTMWHAHHHFTPPVVRAAACTRLPHPRCAPLPAGRCGRAAICVPLAVFPTLDQRRRDYRGAVRRIRHVLRRHFRCVCASALRRLGLGLRKEPRQRSSAPHASRSRICATCTSMTGIASGIVVTTGRVVDINDRVTDGGDANGTFAWASIALCRSCCTRKRNRTLVLFCDSQG
jgi:hypothetical protein